MVSIIAMAFVLTAQQALAVTHTEIGDAPALPPGQVPIGSGALTSISGSIDGEDMEDVYQVCVTGDSFSATTVGGSDVDTQLFLFNDDGTGVARGTVGNDDSSSTFQSTLPNGGTPLDNGGTLSYLPGVYYLAISAWDDDPVDAGGNLIFPSSPFSGVYGPNADAGPWTGWTGGSTDSGPYTITLSGAATLSSALCVNPETICTGSPPPDAIVGDLGNNVIVPGFNSTGGPGPTSGDDVIFGLGGNDLIDGGDGNDVICGGSGNDAMWGGNGNDIMSGGSGNDAMWGGNGDDVMSGGSGNDAMWGGNGDDVMSGGSGNDNVDGGAGTNRTSGDSGFDNCDNPDPLHLGDFGCEV